MESNYSLADVAAATRGNDGFGFGGDGVWIFGLLILLGLFNGGFGFGGNRNPYPNGEPVTEAGLCNAMNFNNLENAVGRLNDNQAAIARQTDNAICQLGYQALQNTNSIQSQLADCCCTTQRAIDNTNYNIANSTAAINANTTAQTQKILDAICQNKIETLQAKVNELQTAQMLCGVPRINPYGYGITPQFACGCNTCM